MQLSFKTIHIIPDVKSMQVLLLDEVTVDMDVVGRLDLLAFFEEECAARGATILYATHIFDGLTRWSTHLALVENGAMVLGGFPQGLVCSFNITPAVVN